MDLKTVRTLLEKHYGNPHQSLTLDDDGEAARKTYFYFLGQKEKEINAVRTLLGTWETADDVEKLPDLRQTISVKGTNGSEIPHCVCLTEYAGQWSADFHFVTGVEYRQVPGNKAAATLLIETFPFVSLSERDKDFYGFWHKYPLKKTKRKPKNPLGLPGICKHIYNSWDYLRKKGLTLN